jgi:hypothetical protein
MIKEISNIVDSALPVISIASITAGAFMGRKFGLAAGYGVSSKVAGFIGKQHVADEWNKASSDYWTLAKKDAFRDLTAAAGFITLGIASNLAGKALAKEEPKEEPGWLDNIPVLNTIWEYKKSALAVIGLGSFVGLGSFAIFIFQETIEQQIEYRGQQFKDCINQSLITIRQPLITKRNLLSSKIGFQNYNINNSEKDLTWLRLIRNSLNSCINFIEPEKPRVDLSKPISLAKMREVSKDLLEHYLHLPKPEDGISLITPESEGF